MKNTVFIFCCLDAKSNEKVIENLKNAIEVQEETMEKQDMVLQEREEELKQLQNGKKNVVDKQIKTK